MRVVTGPACLSYNRGVGITIVRAALASQAKEKILMNRRTDTAPSEVELVLDAHAADLYITSASIELTPDELHDQTHAGGLFRYRPGVVGLPQHSFKG